MRLLAPSSGALPRSGRSHYGGADAPHRPGRCVTGDDGNRRRRSFHSGFIRTYNDRQTPLHEYIELARHPHLPEGRLTSVTRSIDLSWQSNRLQEPGRRLLGASPAGLVRADREALLLGEAALEAAEQVLEVGFAVASDRRLDLLPPVRGYAQAMQPPEAEELDCWCRHFLAQVEALGDRAWTADSGALIERLKPEVPNLEVAIGAAQFGDRHAQAVATARGFGILIRLTGLGALTALFTLADACRMAADSAGEAGCLRRIGDVTLEGSHYDVARSAFERALPLYRQVGDVEGEAHCTEWLGDIALRRSQYDAARAAYEQALPLYRQVDDLVGEADCIMSLGDIRQALEQYDDAVAECKRASQHYVRIGNRLGDAACIRRLGGLARQQSRDDAAHAAYKEALPLYRQVGSVLGEANCIRGLGDIALSRSQYDAARAAYEQALPLYRQVGDVLGEANCIRSLGDIALECSQHDAAQGAWEPALALYARIPEPYSIGWTHHRLARIATGAERASHIEAARQAWTSIDRPDLVALLDALGRPSEPHDA